MKYLLGAIWVLFSFQPSAYADEIHRISPDVFQTNEGILVNFSYNQRIIFLTNERYFLEVLNAPPTSSSQLRTIELGSYSSLGLVYNRNDSCSRETYFGTINASGLLFEFGVFIDSEGIGRGLPIFTSEAGINCSSILESSETIIYEIVSFHNRVPDTQYARLIYNKATHNIIFEKGD
ncbi:MAG: hypothetical protein V3V13_08435 [Paracoccaceae bacterium]